MRNYSLMLLLLLTSYVKAQTTYLMWNDVQTQRFGKETLFKSENKFLNGNYKLAEESGAYAEATFKNGKMVGVRKDYDFTGHLEQEVNFDQEGKAQGKSISYYSNGEVYRVFNYKNGLKDGVWKTFDAKGMVMTTEVYKNDLKAGKWVRKLKDGRLGTKLIEINYFENNKPTGTWTRKTEDGRPIWERIYTGSKEYIKREYHTNQKLSLEETFKDNRLDGTAKYYNPSGILLAEKNYLEGYLQTEIKFYENGNKKEIVNSKDGYKDGIFQKYSETGKLIVDGKYAIGHKFGEWKHYNDDNMLEQTYTYANGTKNGISKTYNDAGKIENEGMYLNDEKTGLWTYYKLNGKVAKEVEYKNDEIISEKKYN